MPRPTAAPLHTERSPSTPTLPNGTTLEALGALQQLARTVSESGGSECSKLQHHVIDMIPAAFAVPLPRKCPMKKSERTAGRAVMSAAAGCMLPADSGSGFGQFGVNFGVRAQVGNRSEAVDRQSG